MPWCGGDSDGDLGADLGAGLHNIMLFLSPHYCRLPVKQLKVISYRNGRVDF